MFKDRREAGELLAKRLEEYRGTDAIVLALPRGGVVLGYEIAKTLGLPLDVIIVRKIGAPGNPEYAIGAIDERGNRLSSEISREYEKTGVDEEAKRQQKEALRRARLYRAGASAPALKHKIVILVDDGIATGLTMRLAVRIVRAQKPERVVVAVPIAPEESAEILREEASVVTLEPPSEFLGAVGAHYLHFAQVSDDEVVKLISEAKSREK
ncbi:MAG: hypothetical protein RLZZ416_777 [Candidatus Parcubacteria bacterium]|jgi:predicted phosphoribosyltransferase